MKKIRIHNQNPAVATTPRKGFTLIELLVVIAIIAVLAAILLPALAAAKRRGLRAQDIDNMREIAQGSIMYAGDFADFFPICTLGGGNNPLPKINYLEGIHYSRYLASAPEYNSGSLASGQLFAASYQPYDQNEGFLYAGGFLGNPSIFFNPLLQDPALEASAYSTPTFMSADTTPAIRSPYMFNPRIVSAGLTGVGESSTVNYQRRYQKTSQARQLDVFVLDYIDAGNGGSGGPDGGGGTGVAFSPYDWAQYPSPGIEAAFTDGSVKYCNLAVPCGLPGTGTQTWMQVIETELQNAESTQSYQEYDQLFTACQNSR